MKDLVQYILESSGWHYHHPEDNNIIIEDVAEWLKKGSLSEKQALFMIRKYQLVDIIDPSDTVNFYSWGYTSNWKQKARYMMDFNRELEDKFGDNYKGFFIAKANKIYSQVEIMRVNVWPSDYNLYVWFDKEFAKGFTQRFNQNKKEQEKQDFLNNEKVIDTIDRLNNYDAKMVAEYGKLKPTQASERIIKGLIRKYNITLWYTEHEDSRLKSICEKNRIDYNYKSIEINEGNIDIVSSIIVEYDNYLSNEYEKYYKGIVFGRVKMDEFNSIIFDIKEPSKSYWDKKHPISQSDYILHGPDRSKWSNWTGD